MVDYKFLFLTNESFKFIKDFEMYMISDCGRVFSIKSHRFLKPYLNSHNYYFVSLSNYSIAKKFSIHRLVAKSFLNNPENKRCVDHINNIRTDNRLANLRWCSDTENNRNSKIRNDSTTGIKGISFNKTCNKYYVQIRINRKLKYIGDYKTLEEATIARKKVANELFGEFTHSSEKY